MDGEGFSFLEYRQCLHDISRLSAWTGQSREIFKYIKNCYRQEEYTEENPMVVMEIGFGSGDFLAFLASQKMHLKLIGIDLHPWAEKVAKERHGSHTGIEFLMGDIRTYALAKKPDVIISSLVLHHFSDQEIVDLVSWMNGHCRQGWIAGDLQRHHLAMYGVKLLSQVLRVCPIVKNDAPLSVCRSFRAKDWQRILGKSGVCIERKFPFKYSLSLPIKGER